MLDIIKQHIEATPGTCGGKPRIAGHRIRVMDIAVAHEQQGMSPDEIVSMYPSLTLSDVHAALAYYFDYRDEILRDIAEERRYAKEVRLTTPSPLHEKLQRRSAG
ncbi:MAG: DUF433 domain-containing protein [Acidobacteria bacterium]|nr:DUF433 domain-containing protein [Acidobacteriota bacterium]